MMTVAFPLLKDKFILMSKLLAPVLACHGPWLKNKMSFFGVTRRIWIGKYIGNVGRFSRVSNIIAMTKAYLRLKPEICLTIKTLNLDPKLTVDPEAAHLSGRPEDLSLIFTLHAHHPMFPSE